MEEEKEEEIDILKERILAWIVEKTVSYSRVQGRYSGHLVSLEPIVANWEEFANTPEVAGEVIAVLPATTPCYVVSAPMPSGHYEELGYEIEGCYHPDWVELAKEQIERFRKAKEQIK